MLTRLIIYTRIYCWQVISCLSLKTFASLILEVSYKHNNSPRCYSNWINPIICHLLHFILYFNYTDIHKYYSILLFVIVIWFIYIITHFFRNDTFILSYHGNIKIGYKFNMAWTGFNMYWYLSWINLINFLGNSGL